MSEFAFIQGRGRCDPGSCGLGGGHIEAQPWTHVHEGRLFLPNPRFLAGGQTPQAAFALLSIVEAAVSLHGGDRKVAKIEVFALKLFGLPCWGDEGWAQAWGLFLMPLFLCLLCADL